MFLNCISNLSINTARTRVYVMYVCVCCIIFVNDNVFFFGNDDDNDEKKKKKKKKTYDHDEPQIRGGCDTRIHNVQ